MSDYFTKCINIYIFYVKTIKCYYTEITGFKNR